MRPSTFDPMAGERARAILRHPDVAQPIPDPTDPRYGEFDAGQQVGETRIVVDPTDPACEKAVI